MTEPAPCPTPPRPPVRASLPPGIDAADLRRLAAALAAAADVVRRLPRGAGGGPAGVRSAWPEMIRATRFSVPETRVTTSCRPGPADIATMERMIALLWDVNGRQRQFLWARACVVRWAILQDRFRRSRITLNRDYRGALIALAQAERKAQAAVLKPRPPVCAAGPVPTAAKGRTGSKVGARRKIST